MTHNDKHNDVQNIEQLHKYDFFQNVTKNSMTSGHRMTQKVRVYVQNMQELLAEVV